MNFGWIIPNVLAGSMGPLLVEELEILQERGVKAIVRMERRTISGEAGGLVDLAEFVPDFSPPTSAQMDRIIEFIDRQTEKGSPGGRILPGRRWQDRHCAGLLPDTPRPHRRGGSAQGTPP